MSSTVIRVMVTHVYSCQHSLNLRPVDFTISFYTSIKKKNVKEGSRANIAKDQGWGGGGGGAVKKKINK